MSASMWKCATRSRLNLAGIKRKSRLLERELKLRLSFQRVMVVEKKRVA